MSVHTFLRCVFTLSFALLVSASAHAQLFRAYLASDGNDANPCTLAAPCRLLPAALTAVANGGEIWMLDSANYNAATVTIGKSVSILAVPGAMGSVVSTGGSAISITAADLKVALRNLVIVPLPGTGGNQGVYMTGASTLTIEHSLIANLVVNGVILTGAGTVKIADTIIRNNGGSAVYVGDGATATISRTQMLGNHDGVIANSSTATTAMASVTDSVISGGGEGVYAYAGVAGAVAKVFVTRTTIEGTQWALNATTLGGGSALVTVSYSMVTNNGNGWYQYNAGAVLSMGNNHFAGNTATVGTLSQAPLQ